MFENNRIIVVRSFCRTEQIVQSLVKFTLPELYPTETIEVRGIIWFHLDRAFNHRFGLIQVHVVIGPHIAEIIAGFRRVRRIERD